MDQASQLAKKDPAFAKAVGDTIETDPGFRQYANKITDSAEFLRTAVDWTAGKIARNQRAVAKAKRAAPVKSSSGAVPNTGGSAIDRAIAAAMK
jgi:hypothetical protein